MVRIVDEVVNHLCVIHFLSMFFISITQMW